MTFPFKLRVGPWVATKFHYELTHGMLGDPSGYEVHPIWLLLILVRRVSTIMWGLRYTPSGYSLYSLLGYQPFNSIQESSVTHKLNGAKNISSSFPHVWKLRFRFRKCPLVQIQGWATFLCGRHCLNTDCFWSLQRQSPLSAYSKRLKLVYLDIWSQLAVTQQSWHPSHALGQHIQSAVPVGGGASARQRAMKGNSRTLSCCLWVSCKRHKKNLIYTYEMKTDNRNLHWHTNAHNLI